MTQEITNNKGGRPKKEFTPEMTNKVLAVMSTGGHKTSAACACGVSVNTFNRWLDENDTCREAYDIGAQYSQVYYEELLRECASGVDAEGKKSKTNIKALEFILKNKARKDWAVTEADQRHTFNVLINKPLVALQAELKNFLDENPDIKGQVIEHGE